MPAFPDDPDVRAMLAMKAGRASSLDEVIERHAARLRRFLARQHVTPEDAEDILQETFANVWQARMRWQPQARFSTWLFRIAVNAMLSRFRRASRGGPAFTILDEAPSAESSPSLRLERAEARVRVRAAVDALPEQQRLALTLHCYEECSYLEVGEVLGVSLEAVKSLLFRARQNLKEALASDLEAVRVLLDSTDGPEELRA
jgi:RNA polymerase sigma-70 factor (ECF subfamily)